MKNMSFTRAVLNGIGFISDSLRNEYLSDESDQLKIVSSGVDFVRIKKWIHKTTVEFDNSLPHRSIEKRTDENVILLSNLVNMVKVYRAIYGKNITLGVCYTTSVFNAMFFIETFEFKK